MDTSKLSRKPEERSVGVGGGRGGRYPRDFLKYCPMRGNVLRATEISIGNGWMGTDDFERVGFFFHKDTPNCHNIAIEKCKEQK